MSFCATSHPTILRAAPHPRQRTTLRRVRQDLFRSTLYALMTARLHVPADAADSD